MEYDLSNTIQAPKCYFDNKKNHPFILHVRQNLSIWACFEPTSSWFLGLVLHHWATLPSWENKQNPFLWWNMTCEKLLKDLKPQNINNKKSHLPLNFNLDPLTSEAKLFSPTCFTVAILVQVHDLNCRYQYGFGTFFESLCSCKLLARKTYQHEKTLGSRE